MNFEEGSEYSIPDGDEHSERALLEVATSRVAQGNRDLAAESMYEYGTRVGFWRLLRLFEQRKLPVTVFACAQAIERNPEAAAAIRRLDWDICSHGLRWNEQFTLTEDEQRREITEAVASFQRTLGKRPLGWYCRYAPAVFTRKLLIEEGGFLYDSDAYNDDLPYWDNTGARPHLVVPYSLTVNDARLLRGGITTGETYFAFLRDSLDMLRAEGKQQPRMMNVGMHLRILGHPGRAAGLARFLDYVKTLDDVYVCRREDIARHWIGRFPAEAS
ncbi:MAG: polysaccharide deacetylase family protein [Acidobacteriaceae bacterium]|nr:polysaccharide deacetylase family protein [Acidobacteriaceae bacterium]